MIRGRGTVKEDWKMGRSTIMRRIENREESLIQEDDK